MEMTNQNKKGDKMNAAKARRAKKVGLLDFFRKGRSRMDIETPLAILRPSLQLPETMIFEDYVNIGSNVQTDRN